LSENLDHTTGGTFEDGDLIDEQSANTKFIIIQSSTPSPSYDGTIFIDLDDDTPIIRARDDTNSDWLTIRSRKYVTGSTWIEDPDTGGKVDAHSVLKYNTVDFNTRLYFLANDEWWMVGTG